MNIQDEKLDHAEEIDEKDTTGTGYTHVEDPVLEKKIVRHLDRRILPWIFALWLLAFIDRSNVSDCVTLYYNDSLLTIPGRKCQNRWSHRRP